MLIFLLHTVILWSGLEHPQLQTAHVLQIEIGTNSKLSMFHVINNESNIENRNDLRKSLPSHHAVLKTKIPGKSNCWLKRSKYWWNAKTC